MLLDCVPLAADVAALGDELRAATVDRDRGRIKVLDHLRRERTEMVAAPASSRQTRG